jgi:peptide-methionine (R)-S-oxide reductase
MTRAQFLARLIPFVGAPLAVLVATRRDGPSAAAVRAHMSTDIPSGELKKTREEWRQLLHSTAYAVLFEEGTERAFTSPLNEEKRT